MTLRPSIAFADIVADGMKSHAASKQALRQAGQDCRKRIARSAHSEWPRRKGDPTAFDILRATAGDRVPHLLQLKYQRMLLSPFSYFRGAVAVMAHDIGNQPNTGILCQLCGDAHVRNFGAYAAPDGRMAFDINDFDETIYGPFEWDVKRMAASIHLAAREAGESEADCRKAVRVFVHRYARQMAAFSVMPIVEVARYQIHRQDEISTMQQVFDQAARVTPLQLRSSLTVSVSKNKKPSLQDNKASAKKNSKSTKKHNTNQQQLNEKSSERIFRSQPPALERVSAKDAQSVLRAVSSYKQTLQPERRHLLSCYRSVDVGFKVVGTGSVGLRDYIVYMEGPSRGDPLFLQIKQEIDSGWAPYVKSFKVASNTNTPGRRVLEGQRFMQVQSDPFLGSTQLDGRHYLVRQLNDHKASVNLDKIAPDQLLHYADLCGELLARGHARSGFPHTLAGYIGGKHLFEKAIVTFAKNYADQTEKDWKALKQEFAHKA